jgi:isocitrate dehydrogenase (NAD+)
VVHKASVMRATDGLLLSAAREVAEQHGDVELDDVLVDNLAAQLVRRPNEFDILVAPNLYGDILADLVAGLVGSVGLVPGANYGVGAALFEPGHGSAPKHAGRNRVNPVATVLSGALLLRHLDEDEAATTVETAVAAVLAERKRVTYDVRGEEDGAAATTSEMADAVIEKLG